MALLRGSTPVLVAGRRESRALAGAALLGDADTGLESDDAPHRSRTVSRSARRAVPLNDSRLDERVGSEGRGGPSAQLGENARLRHRELHVL